MSKIKSIKAREILDSRGNPTVEAEVETNLGVFFASVASGASTGKYEAKEIRDGGKRYSGKGVLKAVKNVEKVIAPKLKGKDVTKQKQIDEIMIKLDGTENKAKLGANAILPVSMAVCRAGAKAKNIPLYQYISQISAQKPKLPHPSFNVINGGVHAGNDLDIQEFMIVPQSQKFSKNLQTASEIYHKIKEILKKDFGLLAVNIGDEGGFAPPFKDPEQALNYILKAAKKLNYSKNIKIVLDVAASQFYNNKKYKTKIGTFTNKTLMGYYLNLIKKYPICGIEDPFDENDWDGFQMLLQKSGKKIDIIGDDLLVTNPAKIKEANDKQACNTLLLKINQIGTITEALESARLAKFYNWKIMVSHRSGETCDDFIADLSVGIGADFIKTGAPCRGERTSKYNRLLRIEEEIFA